MRSESSVNKYPIDGRVTFGSYFVTALLFSIAASLQVG